MGKWASQKKAGTAAFYGSIPAPGAADWALVTIDNTTEQFQRIAAVTPPATAWRGEAFPVATGTPISQTGIGPDAALNVVGLTVAVAYRAHIAWYSGTLRISDWSAPKLFTAGA